MSGVVVVGSINRDIVVAVPHLPRPGETVLGSGHRAVAGGKGANQAVAAARLGAEVALVGRVGDDTAGEGLRRLLESEGVDVVHVGIAEDDASGHAFIFVDEAGENSIALSPGANQRVRPADLPPAVLGEADVVCLQLEIPIETVAAAGAMARRVVLNAAPAAEVPSELLENVDVLIVNEVEAATLAGSESVAGINQVAAAAGAIAGPGAVAVTLGSRGALLWEDDQWDVFPAPEVAAVDTTGAGDAFCGALAARLARDNSTADAVRWGVAAGALAVTKHGAVPSLPTADEVAALL